MQRIEAAEVKRLKQKLGTWHYLSEMQDALQEISKRAGLYTVAQGELKFVREASIGQICGMLTHARQVRLGDDPPDFVLGYGDGRELECEVVDVIPKNWPARGLHRRYADELSRHGQTQIQEFSYEELRSQSESVVEDVEKQIEAKATRAYEKDYILVVNITHDLILGSDAGHTKELFKLGKNALSSFAEVWFKKDRNILRVSKHSATLITPPWLLEE